MEKYKHLTFKSKEKIASYLLYKINKDKIFIRRIAVSPDFRRGGFGTKMIEKITKKAKELKLKKIFQLVRISNLAGIAFCKKLGFQMRKKIEKYFPDGEAAFLMEKKI